MVYEEYSTCTCTVHLRVPHMFAIKYIQESFVLGIHQHPLFKHEIRF